MATRAATKPPMKNGRRRFAVGDRAFVKIGNSGFNVRIIEDRGPIGFDGRRLLRVLVIGALLAEPMDFEVAESDLMVRRPRMKTTNRLRK